MSNESESYTKAIDICRTLIGLNLGIVDADIDNAIDKACLIYPTLNKELLRMKLMSIYSVKLDPIQILEDKERREPWLMAFKAEKKSKWSFWKRYKKYLEYQKGFAPVAICNIDDLTDKILDKFFDPTRENIEISKKGLVVGQVQSGKTANYSALICKAADAGFNFIIVLAGIHNNLRSQTQLRIDQGFLGFDTMYERAYSANKTTKIGVGLIPGFEEAIANSYTTSSEKGDFTKNSANTAGFNFNAPQPIILVVKKNGTVLKRLSEWLKTQSEQNKIENKSLLIIDDEADNASINTNLKGETPTAINKYICKIVNQFYRSAYVGYTATPFANIFIPLDEKNLFPKDFIINLPAPSNYIGPDKVFGTSIIPSDSNEDLLPIVSNIDDYKNFVPDKHKKDDLKPMLTDVPESLHTAIKCFIVTCAIRILRGQDKKHNSMLIHVSRFQVWQNHIKELVTQIFNYYKHEIEANDQEVLEEFKRIYEIDTTDYKSFKTITQEILNSKYKDIDDGLILYDWEDVEKQLFKAVQKITVKSVNGSSGDSLTYYEHEKEGISVIAIGGDKLSRGLTLEGLSVSYFLRASKMYDTLMQMGRWFGYRPGYVDLCRLFTSGELNQWYKHITLASEELKDEFDYLCEIEGTPDQYSLRVRNHPGLLQITSLAKMRYVDNIRVSWAGRLVETYMLSTKRDVIHSNFVTTDEFLCSLSKPELNQRCYLWRDVDAQNIMSYFEKFQLHESLKKVNLSLINNYIDQVNLRGELNSWNVALMTRNNDNINEFEGFLSNGNGFNFFYRQPSEESSNTPDSYMIRKNHILGNPTEEFVDLDSSILKEALDDTNARYKKTYKKERKLDYPSPKLVREEYRDIHNPLLLIYPLKDKKDYNHAEPYIGFAISFPHTKTDVYVSYAVNMISDFADTEQFFDDNNDNTYTND